jgi:nucleoside-specific outer membrane channel protein Tsx
VIRFDQRGDVMNTSSPAFAFRSIFLASMCLLLLSLTVSAQGVNFTDAQFLFGGPFDDHGYGNNTTNKKMTTLTLEHFSQTALGDSYLFTDLYFGHFVGEGGKPIGSHARVYTEVSPRIAVGKLLPCVNGRRVAHEVYVAAQLNVDGNGFWAYLVGAGIDVALPAAFVIGLNAYYRKDTFNDPTAQITSNWEIPFPSSQRFLFRGYVDIAGTDALGVDLNTQPQFLVTIGSLSPREKLQIGIEWYVHRNETTRTSAPQMLARYLW